MQICSQGSRADGGKKRNFLQATRETRKWERQNGQGGDWVGWGGNSCTRLKGDPGEDLPVWKGGKSSPKKKTRKSKRPTAPFVAKTM